MSATVVTDQTGAKIIGFYNLWNIIRYIIIGILIFYANKQNVSEMEDYKNKMIKWENSKEQKQLMLEYEFK